MTTRLIPKLGFLEQSLELSRLVHLRDDVAPSNELPLHKNLRDRRPLSAQYCNGSPWREEGGGAWKHLHNDTRGGGGEY